MALSILLFAGMFLILGNLFFLAQKTNEDLAVQYAALYVRSLEKFRGEYASQVVSRVEPLGVNVTHDYLDHEGAIPIPATFVIGLSESITEPQSGVKARLYSDYPFPWREDGGPHDTFETEALANLRISPEIEKPYIRFEDFDGRYSLRYAKAVTLGEQCVDCHNTHPDTPKANWLVSDSIMALFDKPNNAVDAAIGLIHQLAVYNQSRQEQNLAQIEIGIGLNTGRLMLGTIGENDRMDGTVISDAVNVASRLEGLTKLYKVPLVISESTYIGLVDRDRYAVRLMDRVKVKGKLDPITVYEVFNGDSLAVREKKMALKQDFEDAINLFQLKQFHEARKLFKKCLKVYPEDKAASMYIDRCDYYLKFGWDESWDGVSQMTQK